MKNKVYVVTEGEYSDYRIVGIYSTKKQAKKIQKLCDIDCNDIEEYIVDDIIDKVDYINKNKLLTYNIVMLKNGNTERIEKINPDILDIEYIYESTNHYNIYGNPIKKLYMSVFAKDEKHAVKIVNEKRIQLLASNKWM